MFNNYIPVNLNRNNATIYSSKDIYPVETLVKVHDALTSGNTNDVVVNDGIITLLTQPDVKWHLTDFYMAHKAYEVAVENKFSYYAVMNEHDVPALFISKQFHGHRILCNAYTMESVLVSSNNYLSKIASMIDHSYPNKYCMNLFTAISNIYKGSSKYLTGILVHKGNADMTHLRVSPVMAPYINGIEFGYTPSLIEEFREIKDGATQTDSLIYSNGVVSFREDVCDEAECSLPPFKYTYIVDVVNLYDKIVRKNVSYLPIYVETRDGVEVHSYISTDGTMLVDANTFECVKLRNSLVIKMFAMFASCDACSASDLQMGWSIAKTEK